MYIDFLEQLGRAWVTEESEKIVGFCYADKVNASIWALFVSPGHEGQGIGQSLLKTAVDWLFDMGHETVHLSTGANTRADRFYAAQGWMRAPSGAIDIRYSLKKPQAAE